MIMDDRRGLASSLGLHRFHAFPVVKPTTVLAIETLRVVKLLTWIGYVSNQISSLLRFELLPWDDSRGIQIVATWVFDAIILNPSLFIQDALCYRLDCSLFSKCRRP